MANPPSLNEHNRQLKAEKIRRKINAIHDRRVRSWARDEESIQSLQRNLAAMDEQPEVLFQPDWDDPLMLSTYQRAGLDQ